MGSPSEDRLVKTLSTQCCIAGGGPAGLMLGYLLARAGVDVIVLEKHADFLRDFRGDTIHPSTMQALHELGLLRDFLKLPHQRVPDLVAQFGNERLKIADFSHLPVAAPFIAMMPQWDFLNFIAGRGRAFPRFRLMMLSAATGLIQRDGRIAGLRASTDQGDDMEIEAALTVAADGRGSDIRDAADLVLEDFGAPMDALWFRLSRQPSDTDQTQGRFDAGRIFVMLNRGDYWQCAFVIPKGWNERVRAAGLAAFRDGLRPLLPFDSARADDIRDWEQVKLLTVQVNRLRQWWRPGLLCIGDAAHAMSPIGGVGVNLAVQDAIAAANLLAPSLREGAVADADLAAVQRRRAWPTRVIQRLQLVLQNRIIAPALAERGPVAPPAIVRLMAHSPILSRIPARLIGLGVRPEHVAAHIVSPST
jgi:2-polyprenyl-6-methoxyphenol hydroxylase-like FAD-dependent oxidoreductase